MAANLACLVEAAASKVTSSNGKGSTMTANFTKLSTLPHVLGVQRGSSIEINKTGKEVSTAKSVFESSWLRGKRSESLLRSLEPWEMAQLEPTT